MLVRGRPSSGGNTGPGIGLDDIPADAAVDVASLRTLGPEDLQALDKATADDLYDVAGAADAAVANADFSSATVTSARVAARFRGIHQSGVNYLRGDIILVPGTQSELRWATMPHLSGAWSKPNEFTGGNQWLPVDIPGFRGIWLADVWYRVNDLLVAGDGSGNIVQCLYSHTDSVYNAARFATPLWPTLPSAVRPNELIRSNVPDLGKDDSHGLWPKNSRIERPRARRLVTLDSPSDITSTVNGTGGGTGSLDQDPDPVSYSGSVRITFPLVATIQLAQTVDLSANILRAPAKLTGSTGGTAGVPPNPGTPKLYGGISGAMYLEVSSNNFATANYHRVDIVHHNDPVTQIPDNAWWWTGCGPADWEQVGSGANLAAINAIRVRCNGTGTTLSLGWFDAVPNGQSDKAKIVLWGDDNYGVGWTTLAEKASRYGFPVTLASTIGTAVPSQATQMQGDQLRKLTDFHGAQVPTHALTNGLHNMVTDPPAYTADGDSDPVIDGDAFRQQLMESRFLQYALGTMGGVDFAYFGNNLWLTAEVLRIVRQYMRTARRFASNARLGETLPPIDPHAMWCWGVGTTDINDGGAAMIAYAQKAVAQKGYAGFVWHNAPNVELDALLAWCDANRNLCDVVTHAEAVEPFTVAA